MTTGPAADGDEFSYTHAVQTRISDFDAQRHVNNVVYITYLESARVAYTRDVLGRTDLGGWVVAEVRCRYLAPVPFGAAHVEVRLRVSRVGRTSLSFAFAMYGPHGQRVADGEAVQVRTDQHGRPLALGDDWRQRIAAFEARATDGPG